MYYHFVRTGRAAGLLIHYVYCEMLSGVVAISIPHARDMGTYGSPLNNMYVINGSIHLLIV